MGKLLFVSCLTCGKWDELYEHYKLWARGHLALFHLV